MPQSRFRQIRLPGEAPQLAAGGGTVVQTIKLTQAQYDAIPVKNPNILYVIV